MRHTEWEGEWAIAQLILTTFIAIPREKFNNFSEGVS
jgi:hypothetical protein